MFALTFAEYGPPSVLEVTDMPEPHAGPGQVRIVVKAAAVNPFDWNLRAGYMQETMPLELPAIVGFDASGVVDEVGDEGAQGVSVGDEVFGVGQGSTAEYALLDLYAPKPASLSWEQAASLGTAAETALRSLRMLNLSPGQTLLIQGAAGSVGSAAAQLARAAGVTVIGTASPANHDYLRSLEVIPTTYGPGLPQRVAELAPDGVDGVIAATRNASLSELVQIASAPSQVISLADPSAPEEGARMVTSERASDALAKAAELVNRGRFVVRIDSTYPLADAAAAHERSEAGHLTGKIALALP